MALRISTLVGHRHVDVAVECLRSLRALSAEPVAFRVHDDGTLGAGDVERLEQALGGIEVVPRQEADAQVEEWLHAHPACLRFRRDNPLALKLFDVTVMGGDEVVYCDTDVLFLRPFRDLYQRRSFPAAAVFMADQQDAYSVRSWHLLRHPHLRLVHHLNSGIIRFPRARFDLERVEWLVSRPELAFAPVWLEQTCWALMASRLECRLLASDQLVIPEPGQLPLRACVGAHFVSAVRGELSRWVERRAAAPGTPVDVRSVPARHCRAVDLAADEGRRLLRRLRG